MKEGEQNTRETNLRLTSTDSLPKKNKKNKKIKPNPEKATHESCHFLHCPGMKKLQAWDCTSETVRQFGVKCAMLHAQLL